MVKHIEEIAQSKGCTAAQLALAWVLAQGDDLVPIPGTKRRQYLEENVGALDVTLTTDDLRRIDEIAPKGSGRGDAVSRGDDDGGRAVGFPRRQRLYSAFVDPKSRRPLMTHEDLQDLTDVILAPKI